VTDSSDPILARLIEVAMRTRPDCAGRFRMPTERELAEQMQVQRPTLRDRLKVLETLGLVRRQQGSGTYLALPDAGFLQVYFDLALKLGQLPLEQIQDAMELIGVQMAASAAIRADEGDFAALQEAVEAIDGDERPQGFIDAQFRFHASLARACHNPVLVLLIEALAGVIRQLLAQHSATLSQVAGARARNAGAYRVLMQAIRDREPDAARDAMQECHASWRREAAKISLLDPGE
jgi:GntR family transcriptional repressor for pyruvate dehydrogenase complex